MTSLRKLLLFVACITAFSAMAEDISVHFNDLTLSADDISEMVVTYDNDVPDVRGFQIAFNLPEGIHLLSAQVAEQLGNACPNLTISFSDRNRYKTSVIMVFQVGTRDFPKGKLDLLKLRFQAEPNMVDSTYNVKTSRLLFTSDKSGAIEVENQTFKITCTGHSTGKVGEMDDKRTNASRP